MELDFFWREPLPASEQKGVLELALAAKEADLEAYLKLSPDAKKELADKAITLFNTPFHPNTREKPQVGTAKWAVRIIDQSTSIELGPWWDRHQPATEYFEQTGALTKKVEGFTRDELDRLRNY